MININQLCIGNCVCCTISNDAGVYKVISIPNWEDVDDSKFSITKEPKIVIDRCPRQIVTAQELRPVIITRKNIVEYCSFIEMEGHEGFYSPIIPKSEKTRMRIWFYKNACMFSLNTYSTVLIKGLHHLQNLYSNLHDQELEINL